MTAALLLGLAAYAIVGAVLYGAHAERVQWAPDRSWLLFLCCIWPSWLFVKLARLPLSFVARTTERLIRRRAERHIPTARRVA